MIKNLRITVSMLLLSIISFSLYAQEEPISQKKRLTELKSTLDLTTEQEQKIKQIFAENKDSHKELKAKVSGIKGKTIEEKQQLRAELMEFRSQTKTKIQEILTPEQNIKFEQMIKERQAKFAERKAQIIQDRKAKK